MLDELQEFRNKLDGIMLNCMHSKVLLYGYESYTGRFIKWYAEYYHNIKIAYLVSTDMSRGRAYDQEIFRPNILDTNYKDVQTAVIWVTEPVSCELGNELQAKGYVKGKTWFDFFETVYGDAVFAPEEADLDIFMRRKSGKRDIQFLEWLEWKYDCNFVTRIPKDKIDGLPEGSAGYGCTTQKEIFPMLDFCHIVPGVNDAIFDFGCGKGGPIISFLDYGFQHAGGVEYDARIFRVLQQNVKNLNLGSKVDIINADATILSNELDRYNWFYFFKPFDEPAMRKVIRNIEDSINRKKRVVHIIFVGAMNLSYIEEDGIFRLINQFTVDMRSRVVSIFDNKNYA